MPPHTCSRTVSGAQWTLKNVHLNCCHWHSGQAWCSFCSCLPSLIGPNSCHAAHARTPIPTLHPPWRLPQQSPHSQVLAPKLTYLLHKLLPDPAFSRYFYSLLLVLLWRNTWQKQFEKEGSYFASWLEGDFKSRQVDNQDQPSHNHSVGHCQIILSQQLPYILKSLQSQEWVLCIRHTLCMAHSRSYLYATPYVQHTYLGAWELWEVLL